jgi:tetratricopeptide (TPR) repeat protein
VAAGRALQALSRYDEAAQAFSRALHADPVHAQARRMLGLCLAAQGRFDDAIETWDFWSRLGSRSAEEDALGGWVSRLRSAAELLGRGVRASHE